MATNNWVQAPPAVPFAPNSGPKPEWAYFCDGPPKPPPKSNPAANKSPDIFFIRDTVNSSAPPSLNMCWTLGPPLPGWVPPAPPPAAEKVAPQPSPPPPPPPPSPPPAPPPVPDRASPPPGAAVWFSAVPCINGWTLGPPPPPPPPPTHVLAAAAPAPPAQIQINQQGYYRFFYQLV